MSVDKKVNCVHNYCSDEYCSELWHLVPNQNNRGENLLHVPMTDAQAGVIAFVLSKFAAKDDEPITAVDIILEEIQGVVWL